VYTVVGMLEGSYIRIENKCNVFHTATTDYSHFVTKKGQKEVKSGPIVQKQVKNRPKVVPFYYRFFSTCRITACGKSSGNFEMGWVRVTARRVSRQRNSEMRCKEGVVRGVAGYIYTTNPSPRRLLTANAGLMFSASWDPSAMFLRQ